MHALMFSSTHPYTQLLTTYASIEDLVLRGDGLCNRGPLNTANCGYDVRIIHGDAG